MFRLLGFLIGSATALTIILLVLGIPDFHLADSGIDQQRFDAAVEMLKEKQQKVAVVAEDVIDDVTKEVDAAVADVQDNIETVTEKALPLATAQMAEEANAIEESVAPPLAREVVAASDYPAIATELQWYSFWNPFRSEIAARGFVSQLEKVTGLDYRVVRVKTGVYEVAFAYGNDVERRTKLSQISAATGLDLPGS